MSRIWPALAASLALVSVLAVSAPVAAQPGQVFVLGIRSVEGDDEVARNLTGAIRQEARGIEEWSVADAEISLAQMSVAHGCDEPDAQCMAEIAAELEASRIVYGTVRRTGAGEEYDYALTLYNFNSGTGAGQIEDSLTDTIPRVQSDIDALRPRARRYMAQFAGQARYGSVRVQTSTPGATVYIGGANVGVTDDAGALVVTDVTEGEQDVRIEAVDHEAYEGSVRVVPDEQTEFRTNLIQTRGPNLGWIPGAAVIAVGVVFGALGMTFGLKAQAQKDERSELLAQANRSCIGRNLPATGPITRQDRLEATQDCGVESGFELTPLQAGLLTANSEDSVCDDPDSRIDGLEDACSDRTKFRIFQWVFYGLGAAAVGAGVILLINGLDDGEEAEGAARGPTLELQPWMAGVRDMGVNARLEW